MRTSKKLYTSTAVETFISKLLDQGYDLMTIEEGSLLEYGKALLIAPDTKHYNFIIQEKYLNEWSSAYTVNRRACLNAQAFMA